MPLITEQKYPFRNTLVKYKLPARRCPKREQIKDLALEGYGVTETLNVLSLMFVACESIHLGLNGFTPKHIPKLVDAIGRRHPYVQYLDLWGNTDLGDEGVHELLLRRGAWQGGGGASGAMWRNLRVLNLSRCRLTLVGLAYTLKFLGLNAGSRINNVRCLSLANNRFSQFPGGDYLRNVLGSMLARLITC